MSAEFAYMTSAKNLSSIFDRIAGAGTPPKFTYDFLKTLNFQSSSDRPVIGVLKGLGFLTPDGVPTDRYNSFRDGSRRGAAMAAGLRDGWAPIFLADQSAQSRSSSELTELFKSVSGKGEAVAKKMATTFKLLCDMADWSSPAPELPEPDGDLVVERVEPPGASTGDGSLLRLHHDIHVHLPPTSELSVYTAIFRALKAELLD